MMGVKGSYRELTGLQPVELKDITIAVASGKAERKDITTAAGLLSVISR